MVLTLAMAGSSLAQDKPAAEKKDGAIITFDEKTYDFGDIMQGDKVEHTFYFTNTGNEPLIITNVQVSCGCTVPKGWPRDPIPPNGKGELTVSFNSAGKSGRQNKPVTIISNAVNPEGTQITFTTNVLLRDTNPQ